MPIERRLHRDRVAGLPVLTGFGHVRHAGKVRLTPHIHVGELEVVHVASGEFHWWAGQTAYHLRGGDVYLTPPDLPHGSVTDVLETGEIRWFTVRLPKRGRLRQIDASGRLAGALRRLPTRHMAGGELLPSLLDRLFALLERGREGDAAAGEEARNWIAASLWEIVHRTDAVDANTRQISVPIIRVMQAMEAHLDNRLTLQNLAHIAQFSPSHFKTRFCSEVGIAPGRYYLRRRVTAAAEAIREGDASLIEIASDFGFSSTQYLATCMRRELGKSPTEIREDNLTRGPDSAPDRLR